MKEHWKMWAIWGIGVAFLFAACLPTPFWLCFLGLAVVLTLGAPIIAVMRAR